MILLPIMRATLWSTVLILYPFQHSLAAAEPVSAAAAPSVTGTIANVDGSALKLTIRGKDMTRTFLSVAAGTAIFRNGKPVPFEALHAGDAVTAIYTIRIGEEPVATTIAATAAKPKAGHRKR